MIVLPLQNSCAFPANPTVFLNQKFFDVSLINKALHVLKQAAGNLESFPVKHHQIDVHIMVSQEFPNGLSRHGYGNLRWAAEYT